MCPLEHIRAIKSRRIRWAGHKTHMERIRIWLECQMGQDLLENPGVKRRILIVLWHVELLLGSSSEKNIYKTAISM